MRLEAWMCEYISLMEAAPLDTTIMARVLAKLGSVLLNICMTFVSGQK